MGRNNRKESGFERHIGSLGDANSLAQAKSVYPLWGHVERLHVVYSCIVKSLYTSTC